MKPIYVCPKCLCSSHKYLSPEDCDGTLQPAFLASDIEKLIKENKFSTDQDGMTESYECVAVDLLLSALEEVKK